MARGLIPAVTNDFLFHFLFVSPREARKWEWNRQTTDIKGFLLRRVFNCVCPRAVRDFFGRSHTDSRIKL